jgi:hypothetical protein
MLQNIWSDILTLENTIKKFKFWDKYLLL